MSTQKPNAPLSLFLAVTLGAGQLLSATVARADAASCSASHTNGQREAKAGHLKTASQAYTACASDDSCPQEIRNECIARFGEVESLVPSMVFGVKSESGDLSRVKVYSGEQLLIEELDGRAVSVDPGKHHFRFVLETGEELSSDVLVREGEKNRLITVTAPSSARPAIGPSASGVASAPTTGSQLPQSTAIPAGFWISAGLGVAALGSFGTFAVLGSRDQSSLAKCSPECDTKEHKTFDRMHRNFLIADVSLGVAAVSAGVATWILLASSGSSKEAPVAASAHHPLTVVPLVTANSAAIVTTAEF